MKRPWASAVPSAFENQIGNHHSTKDETMNVQTQVISGSTGPGKVTSLDAISALPPSGRSIEIEDVPEIPIALACSKKDSEPRAE